MELLTYSMYKREDRKKRVLWTRRRPPGMETIPREAAQIINRVQFAIAELMLAQTHKVGGTDGVTRMGG
jgi:hypothetical protein